MAKRIIKKLGGDRIGSGNKMTVKAHGYGFSTHDVSKIRRTSMSFGTIVPMGQWLLPSGSRLRLNLDALVTSAALKYQLYGSAKFQLDVFSARLALYNPKMELNLNDQGYEISDIKFPLMKLKTKGYTDAENTNNWQVNSSALLRYLGIAGNGQPNGGGSQPTIRHHNAMWLLMYYQTVKEYYANKQEKIGYVIDNSDIVIEQIDIWRNGGSTPTSIQPNIIINQGIELNTIENFIIMYEGNLIEDDIDTMYIYTDNEGTKIPFRDAFNSFNTSTAGQINCIGWKLTIPYIIYGVSFEPAGSNDIRLKEYDLKAIDRMMMRIMANVESTNPLIIDETSESPYNSSFKNYETAEGEVYNINKPMIGMALGTYQSDVFNNWLDNDTINALNNKSKVKVDEQGEFSIDMLNITQKLYNYNQRIGVTDGTLNEWRELTYGQKTVGKSLKPVYEGGLSKEIVFDMVVSTAGTEQDPLGTIASRGQFGSKHKGGYCVIDTDEEKLVMVLCKITPRIVYNQGNDWTTNLKTLEDLHKPALDKIGYQNLITDTMVAAETQVNNTQMTITTYSAGKQPAWQWYRTNYDDALGNMASTEDYKVFGRRYETHSVNGIIKIKDLTTYIDPTKFNEVFAVSSLDAMNFDVQVGMDAKLTLVMSEEVIPNL